MDLSAPPIRLFLATDEPVFEALLEGLEEHFGALTPGLFSFTTLPLGTDPAATPPRPRPEIREGDVVIGIASSAPSVTEHPLGLLLKAAGEQGALILPALASTRQRSSAKAATAGDLPYIVVPFSASEVAADAGAALAARLLERIAPTAAPTDLLQRWNPSRDTVAANALEVLEHEPPAATTAARRKAARAIKARLFEIALLELEQVEEHTPGDPLVAFWRARILLGQNRADLLRSARHEADKAAERAHAREPRGPLALAAHWLAARIAVLQGETDPLAILRVVEDPRRIPASRALLAARLLSSTHQEHTLVELLRATASREPEILDYAQADPLLRGHAAVIAPIGDNLRPAIAHATAALLESEQHILIANPGLGTATAADQVSSARALAAAENDAASLEAISAASVTRQLAYLNEWGTLLITQAAQLEKLRAERRHLEHVGEQLPVFGKFDGLLENLWSPLREKRDELEAALRASHREIEKLRRNEVDARRFLRSLVTVFVDCAERFEAAITDAPEVLALASLPALAAQQLNVFSLAQLAQEKCACDANLLPAELIDLAPERPERIERGLFRVEQEKEGPVASRLGVYFFDARRRFSA